MCRDSAKAKVEHAIDAMAPGVAEQLAGKAKAEIGEGEKLLGALTGHPDIARAGRKLEAEGKVEEIMGVSRRQQPMLPSTSRPLASESRKS